jgi:hypothetical protein
VTNHFQQSGYATPIESTSTNASNPPLRNELEEMIKRLTLTGEGRNLKTLESEAPSDFSTDAELQ